jgi:hypothetical protein
MEAKVTSGRENDKWKRKKQMEAKITNRRENNIHIYIYIYIFNLILLGCNISVFITRYVTLAVRCKIINSRVNEVSG